MELEKSWKNILTVWWPFFWRLLVINFLLGFGLGYSSNYLTLSGEGYFLFVELLPNILMIPVGMYIFKYVLGKKYKKFRIVLVPNDSDEKEGLK